MNGKLLDPLEIDYGNFINDIADQINGIRDERDTEMVPFEDDFCEGYAISLSEFSEYDFPDNEENLKTICKDLEESLDWVEGAWIEGSYLYVII